MNKPTYFILTRNIFDSAIWGDDPEILKLFIYLIGSARHSKIPKKYGTLIIKRGELVTSLSELADNNAFIRNGTLKKWSRQKVARMLEKLEAQEYIRKISDTFGTHLSICNYDRYQRPENYKTDTNGTEMEQQWNEDGTEVETNNNVNNVNNAKNVNNDIHAEIIDTSLNFHQYKKSQGKSHKDFKTELTENSTVVINGAKEIDKLIRLDKETLDDIKEVLTFAVNDPFWMDNLISLSGIRKNGQNGIPKYFNIKNKINSNPNGFKKETVHDHNRRIIAEMEAEGWK